LSVLLVVNVGLSSACLYKLNSSEKYEEIVLQPESVPETSLVSELSDLTQLMPQKSLPLNFSKPNLEIQNQNYPDMTK
jgi:hypothetical protein